MVDRFRYTDAPRREQSVWRHHVRLAPEQGAELAFGREAGHRMGVRGEDYCTVAGHCAHVLMRGLQASGVHKSVSHGSIAV